MSPLYSTDLSPPAPIQPVLRSVAWVERTVARYPDVRPDELDDLVRWFTAASALDVGLVASNEGAHDAYAAFRKDHLDRFTWRDALRGGLFVLLFGGAVTAILALASS